MTQAPFQGKIQPDFRDSVPAWPVERKPDGDAPNVVLVVLDDVGYAQLGCYGSDIATPNIDRLAADGLRMQQFNTTGICSASRSCILTGRNHHSNHMGAVAELATGFPGYDFRMPKENGTLAEILRAQGWGTLAIGKWHLTPAEEQNLGANRSRWPLSRGFDRFYGFHGSDTSQYYPDLVYDNHQVPPPKTPEEGYHVSEDLADKSIEFVRDLHNAAPGKPFFLYFALGAMHTPLHAPRDYIDRYKGQFDLGWDEWRKTVYQRMLSTGILPPGTELTPRPDWIPAWDTLNDTEKRVYARLMEVYAGFLEHTDAQIGRVMDALDDMGKLDNTIFIVISDNGASPEGGRNGTFNNLRYLNGISQTADDVDKELDRIGGPDSNPHYPMGWAWAGNTPFQRWKQEVHAGGVADPFIISWPKGLRDRGAIRPQYAHAIDVTPTVLNLLGIAFPDVIEGIQQSPVHGTSFAHCLADPEQPSNHLIQYYEIRGCRAMYAEGWKAVTYHPRIGLAWDGSDPTRPYSADKWELYHLETDFSERHDLADKHPDIVRNLVDMWWAEAGKYDVLPLDNRGVARLSTRKALQYEIVSPHKMYRSPGTIREHGAINLKNQSHAIEATVDVPESGAEGVLLSMGNGYAGYAFFVHDGVPVYTHNYASLDEYEVVSSRVLSPGRAVIRFEFEKTGEHTGIGRMFINGDKVGEAVIAKTIPVFFAGAEMAVGYNPGYGVSRRYRDRGRFEFNGDIEHVVIEAEGAPQADRDALERVAMAIQ